MQRIITAFLLLFFVIGECHAAEVMLPIRANIVQCGRREDMAETIKNEPRCIIFQWMVDQDMMATNIPKTDEDDTKYTGGQHGDGNALQS